MIRMSGVKRFVTSSKGFAKRAYHATLGRAVNFGSRGLTYLGARARSARKGFKTLTGFRR
jgi:hypothetical protein